MNEAHKKKLATHKERLAGRNAKADSLMVQFHDEWKLADYEEYGADVPIEDMTGLDPYIDRRNKRWEDFGILTCISQVERRLGFHWKAGRKLWGVPNTLLSRRTS